jgi:hypothetical protein
MLWGMAVSAPFVMVAIIMKITVTTRLSRRLCK